MSRVAPAHSFSGSRAPSPPSVGSASLRLPPLTLLLLRRGIPSAQCPTPGPALPDLLRRPSLRRGSPPRQGGRPNLGPPRPTPGSPPRVRGRAPALLSTATAAAASPALPRRRGAGLGDEGAGPGPRLASDAASFLTRTDSGAAAGGDHGFQRRSSAAPRPSPPASSARREGGPRAWLSRSAPAAAGGGGPSASG